MISKHLRRMAAIALASNLVLAMPTGLFAAPGAGNAASESAQTTTPIKHVIVIFGENESFDHYFGTYPRAANPKGEPFFEAKEGTPRANNLLSGGLLTENPNSTQPFRMDTGLLSVTCDQDHSYTPEQQALDKGLMDKFPESTGTGSSAGSPCNDYGKGPGVVMGYFDGNTVTAFWNYAQHYAMSDNSYGTNFGPSSVGAINLVSGNTCCATLLPFAADGVTPGNASGDIAGAQSFGALIGDARPGFDNCLTTPGVGTVKSTRVTMSGLNVGDLLNKQNVTWGWFAGGFATVGKNPDGTPACGTENAGLASPTGTHDYIPHHEPFQYYQSTANPNHLPPQNLGMIGKTDQANHQYDLSLFYVALTEGRLPSVSFLKAKGAQDGHAGYSDPLDEQTFLVNTINAIQGSLYWKDRATIISYQH